MRLNKTHGNLTAPETAAKNAVAQKAMSKAAAAKNAETQAAKPAAAANAVSKIPQSASPQAVIRSLGLPTDKLSASIISFARFFSLPLKPEVLQHIRQQAFTMTPNATPSNPAAAGKGNAPEAETVLKIREALSLAASAAEGKGAELHPKGLETYARALDPEWRKREDGEQGDRRGKREKNDDDNESLQKTGAVNAKSLEKTALEWAEKNPLLAILNRLPSKDGKRWIVFPFDFSDNGREFKVSLRILIETGKTVNRAACMALDVAIRSTAEDGKTEKRCLFVLEPANRLSVYLQPEITTAQQVELVRKLSALLEIATERIFIKTQTESFPFEAGRGDNLLGSVDEAV